MRQVKNGRESKSNSESKTWDYFFILSLFLFVSGLKSNLSESSSIWISETHEISNTAPNHNSNNIINKVNDLDRPATANSLKTSNFDSDEETVPN